MDLPEVPKRESKKNGRETASKTWVVKEIKTMNERLPCIVHFTVFILLNP